MGHRGHSVSGTASRHHRLQKLLKKGLKHHREGHIELAEACYRKMLKVDPTCCEAQEMLRSLAGNAGPARESIRALSATLADDPDALNYRAASYLAESKIQLAIDYFRRVVELRPESAPAHCQLGEAHEQLGDL